MPVARYYTMSNSVNLQYHKMWEQPIRISEQLTFNDERNSQSETATTTRSNISQCFVLGMINCV